jgi:hypothetical protein
MDLQWICNGFAMDLQWILRFFFIRNKFLSEFIFYDKEKYSLGRLAPHYYQQWESLHCH